MEIKNIHPKMIRRWAEIYLKKWDEESKEAAIEWANRHVPEAAVPKLRREIKKVRAEQAGE